MAAWSGWEQALLAQIGAPITAANVAFLDAWQKMEGGGAANNPLNVTWPPSNLAPYNSVGVQNYGSPSDGAAATATFMQHGYQSIITALQSGVPQQYSASIASDLHAWSGGGYSAISSFAGATAGVGNAASLAIANAKEWPLATQRLVVVPVALALGFMMWGALRG